MSYNWDYIVYIVSDWLLQLSNIHLRFKHVFLWFDSSFLFINASYRCTTVSLPSHLLKKNIYFDFKVFFFSHLNYHLACLRYVTSHFLPGSLLILFRSQLTYHFLIEAFLLPYSIYHLILIFSFLES